MVNLLCDMERNISRLESEERQSNGKMKLVDRDVLEKIRQEASLLDRETIMKCGKRGEVFYFWDGYLKFWYWASGRKFVETFVWSNEPTYYKSVDYRL